MKNVQTTHYFSMALSFVCGMLLTIMPLPHAILWFRPQWMLMILLFWVISSPAESSILVAWLVGMLMDLVLGLPLGKQALVYVVMTYLVLKFHAPIAYALRWQQAGFVGLLASLSVFMQHILFNAMGRHLPLASNVLSIILTVILWPSLFFILDQWRPREYL